MKTTRVPLRAILVLMAVAGCATPGDDSIEKQQEKAMNDSRDVLEVLDFDKAWNYQDPAATEVAFREFLEKAHSDDASYVLQLKTQIARTFGLRGQFDESHELLDEVQTALIAAKDPALDLARVRYALERGRSFNSGGDKEKAIVEFTRAWEIGQKVGNDRLTVDALHMLGIADQEESIAWNERAMVACEESIQDNVKGWLGPLYNNTGWTYHEQGAFDKALNLWEKSLAFNLERTSGDETQDSVLIARWTIARCMRSQGKHDAALEILDGVRKTREENNKQGGYTYEEIGENLLAKGQEGEAAPWFEKAWSGLKDDVWLQRNEAERLARLKKLGGVE